MQAISFGWPYIAYSGLTTNSLILINAYAEKKMLHRVLLPTEDESSFRIHEIFITDTYDCIFVTSD